jgi:TolB protein
VEKVGGPSRFNALEWTPDGKFLLFVYEEGNGSAIWRVPASGGEAERIGITMNARIKSPFMHPDGKSLFFTAVEADNNEVWALENFLPKGVIKVRER